jgi:hypothetical protein
VNFLSKKKLKKVRLPDGIKPNSFINQNKKAEISLFAQQPII